MFTGTVINVTVSEEKLIIRPNCLGKVLLGVERLNQLLEHAGEFRLL
jgi:hypothetical protein